MSEHLPEGSPISSSDDQDLFWMGMREKGDMADHFAVDILVVLREHDESVMNQHPSELRILNHVNGLVGALSMKGCA